MNLKELYDESKKDLSLGTELDRESIQTPYKVSKWIKLLIEESLRYKKLDQEFKTLRTERFEHYLTDYDIILDKKDIYNTYLPGDVELQEIEFRLEQCKQKMNVCEMTSKALSQNTFTIKNAIEWKKFQHGQ